MIHRLRNWSKDEKEEKKGPLAWPLELKKEWLWGEGHGRVGYMMVLAVQLAETEKDGEVTVGMMEYSKAPTTVALAESDAVELVVGECHWVMGKEMEMLVMEMWKDKREQEMVEHNTEKGPLRKVAGNKRRGFLL